MSDIKCIHIYCGNGKGKTSSAIGLAVRAAGRNKKVLIARFLKNGDSGELKTLSDLNGIDIIPVEKYFGFYSKMTEIQKKEAKEYYSYLLRQVLGKAKNYDVIIMDEIITAYNYSLVVRNDLEDLLEKNPCEIIITGRDPSAKLIEYADYISEIKKIKHPYDKGIKAREGIEY